MEVVHVPRLYFVAVLLCAGCASPGPPKPPSLRLPQLVKDLSAERVGDQVLLHWTTPALTTDYAEISEAISAELCRETDPRPSAPGDRLPACAPIRRLAVFPGPSEVLDSLPIPLQTDPITVLSYRVQIFNSIGHSAGKSLPALAGGGEAPAPVDSLKATLAEQGVILEWHTTLPRDIAATEQIEFRRTNRTSASPSEKKPSPLPIQSPAKKSQKDKPVRSMTPTDRSLNEIHLRAADTLAGSKKEVAGTVDTTAEIGDTYSYTAQRIRVIRAGAHVLEIRSQLSAPVTITMKDIFPPKVPTGLATIKGDWSVAHMKASAGSYIDLSWEPNSEPDLEGYRVYRQLARPDGSPQGPLARLTALPIAVPAFRDVAVRAGQGYIYSVTAVDAAGNESAPSAKALEVIQAQH